MIAAAIRRGALHVGSMRVPVTQAVVHPETDDVIAEPGARCACLTLDHDRAVLDDADVIAAVLEPWLEQAPPHAITIETMEAGH